MDGENNGKPHEQMDDLGAPLFLETPIYIYIYIHTHTHIGNLSEVTPPFKEFPTSGL